MSQILDRVLTAARQLGASDVHLKAGLPPIFRIKGELRTVRDVPALTREAIASFAVHMMNDRQRAEFEQNLDIDLAYGTPDGVRYRVNLFQQRGSIGMVMRLIPPEVPPFETLNLPKTVLDLTENGRGVVLVTGATGSGKSTTLAAMIDYINQQHAYHIVTIEDPIEYTFRDKRSVINQREVGFDTMTFGRALRAALRQDPDVVLVGEMRDPETAQIAITAAETGHLVLSTLHTVDATETVNRIISMFPTHQQAQARLSLAAVLRGVVSQRLLPRADGKSMVPALEIMVNTERVRELIEDPQRTREIKDAIAEGLHPYGMMSFDQSLAHLVKQRLVTYEEAVKNSTSPSDFALLFRGVSGGTNSGWGQAPVAEANPGASGNDEFEIDRFSK
ncbi:MAG: type IV pilus twitching motility protein PilT [Kofleriaceae bacterium]|nr:type IV pilus twitching motility protein PilT [Kofleriaceae bacterium]MBP6841914.1 type IV pilus twitching motility protein PilT [Kofleriaceae bacterium]MBP9204100.1 type IV pilus twitching motility protein PilT [Kofleriaceae bacterium]